MVETMQVAIITAVYPPSLGFLADAGRSILRQTADQPRIAWVLALNGGVKKKDVDHALRDVPVRRICVDAEKHTGKIGAIKGEACRVAASIAPYILELDADDILAEDAVGYVYGAFEGGWEISEAQMLYSDCAHFGSPGILPFREDYGWMSYKVTCPPEDKSGERLVANRSPESSPHSISRMIFAPDHLRAWASSAYLAVGGHDPELEVADDLDLTQRIAIRYGFDAIKRIPACLYFYRRHPEQRTAELETITRASADLYEKRVEALFLRWAKDKGLRAIDVGGALAPRKGFEVMDRRQPADIVADLGGWDPWPLEDKSVGVLRASHVLEHLPDPEISMGQIHRVLTHGGLARIEVPAAPGAGAWMDPTHRSYWCRETFAYFTDSAYSRWLDSPPRFQILRIEEGAMQLTGTLAGRMVPVVRADLMALHEGGERIPGPLFI